jgi:hypothetical protein
VEGKPLAFGQLLLELLALLPAPDRSGQPVARNLKVGPHPACPCSRAQSCIEGKHCGQEGEFRFDFGFAFG